MRRAQVVVILTVLGLIAPAATADAGSVRAAGWPVTPITLGSLYGQPDPGGPASVRVWGPAIWCKVQPAPEANVAAALDQLLAPHLDAIKAARGTAIVTIGHPAPWVFQDDPQARASAGKTWFCDDYAAGVSVPSPDSLRTRNGVPGLASVRWRSYVTQYVDWLSSRYGKSLRVVLEVWNEPNLKSGIDYRLGIPGAARTREESVQAVYTMESIAHQVVRSRGSAGSITLGSSALLTRPNHAWATSYYAAHNRKRRIDAVHVNIYGISGSTPTGWARDWDRRAAELRAALRRYPALRNLPLRITEANLNLTNLNQNQYNVKPSTAAPATQQRMAAATQMNAYYNGYSSVFWLVPWSSQQAAVHIATVPGNPARDALAVLNSALAGTTFRGCSQARGVRTCTFSGPGRPRIQVLWRLSGTSTLRVASSATMLAMSGQTKPVVAGSRVSVTTTPFVLSHSTR